MAARFPPMTVLAISATLVVSGCVQDPGPAQDDSRPGATTAPHGSESGSTTDASPGPDPGRMTASEEREDAVALCSTGGNPSTPYCATRTIRLTGDVDAATLPLSLIGFNDGLVLESGSAGAWSATVTLSARGLSEDAAKARLDDIAFEWAHEAAGAHVLHVKAEPRTDDTNGLQARIAASLPTDLSLRGWALTSNGNLRVEGLAFQDILLRTSNAEADIVDVAAQELRVETSNGGIFLEADVAQAEVTTSNARIDGTLRPTAHGRLDLVTSNGDIALGLPQDANHGYDVTARTSNGDARIALGAGSSGGDGEVHREFTSNDYARRAIQTVVKAQTSNADIDLEAA